MRPGFYNHHRAAGWRLPADDEDATLDDEFEFESDSDDDDESNESEESDDNP